MQCMSDYHAHLAISEYTRRSKCEFDKCGDGLATCEPDYERSAMVKRMLLFDTLQKQGFCVESCNEGVIIVNHIDLRRKYRAFLNGNNGEWTNGDDMVNVNKCQRDNCNIPVHYHPITKAAKGAARRVKEKEKLCKLTYDSKELYKCSGGVECYKNSPTVWHGHMKSKTKNKVNQVAKNIQMDTKHVNNPVIQEAILDYIEDVASDEDEPSIEEKVELSEAPVNSERSTIQEDDSSVSSKATTAISEAHEDVAEDNESLGAEDSSDDSTFKSINDSDDEAFDDVSTESEVTIYPLMRGRPVSPVIEECPPSYEVALIDDWYIDVTSVVIYSTLMPDTKKNWVDHVCECIFGLPLAQLDDHMSSMKHERKSVYNNSLLKWIASLYSTPDHYVSGEVNFTRQFSSQYTARIKHKIVNTLREKNTRFLVNVSGKGVNFVPFALYDEAVKAYPEALLHEDKHMILVNSVMYYTSTTMLIQSALLKTSNFDLRGVMHTETLDRTLADMLNNKSK